VIDLVPFIKETRPMRRTFSISLAIAIVATVACNKDKAAATPDAAPAPQVTAAATASVAPSASASAAPSAKPAANKPKPVKGCPDGWTRTTKGICVDWCEEDDDCDDGKTCQNSNHIDPDLGKIKTCQPKVAAAPAAVCGMSGVSDEVECPSENCPMGWGPGSKMVGDAVKGSCVRRCKSIADCYVKGNDCVQTPTGGVCISSQGE
jgi:hypothetical protein